MLHEHDDVNLAIKEFEKKFKDKTNNKWSERANFKQKGKYNMVLMDSPDSRDEDGSTPLTLDGDGHHPELPERVAALYSDDAKAQLSAALDPNGNGNVSFKEWREGLRALGIHLGVEQYKVVNGAQNVGANSAHTTCGVWRRDAVRMANPWFWRRPNCAELRRGGLPRSTR